MRLMSVQQLAICGSSTGKESFLTRRLAGLINIVLLLRSTSRCHFRSVSCDPSLIKVQHSVVQACMRDSPACSDVLQ